MKFISCSIGLLLATTTTGLGQHRFGVNFCFSPKMSVNNNTSAVSSNIYQNNEADGHSALGYTYDYSINGIYQFSGKNRLSIGIGKFNVQQIIHPPLALYFDNLRNIRKRYYFLQIPIDFERQLFQKSNWKLFGGLGITFVSDLFYPKLSYRGNVKTKGGGYAENITYWYLFNHLNMETFNLLINASVKVEYSLTKHFSLSAALQAKQGFRPLITSVTFFDKIYQDGSSAEFRVLSINNGQCVLLNIGVGYWF
jgi:hypothetical protein